MDPVSLRSFEEFGLDARLLKCCQKRGFLKPTLIQEQAIPLALSGKDILARARTGSGKTLVYVLPILQKALSLLDANMHHQHHYPKTLDKSSVTIKTKTLGGMAIVLTPTKELAKQVFDVFSTLIMPSYCPKELKVLNLADPSVSVTSRPNHDKATTTSISIRTNTSSSSSSLHPHDQMAYYKSLLTSSSPPMILISTPSRLVPYLSSLRLKESLHILAIDEADLLLSFGYAEDLAKIKRELPPVYQAFILSATLNDDVLECKKILLHSPVILKLEDGLEEKHHLTQYSIQLESLYKDYGNTNDMGMLLSKAELSLKDDRYLLMYVLLKLKLIKGKILIFTNDVDSAYRLKLFLDQFYIRACVLNSELHISSRVLTVEEFNRGKYDCIIAADVPDSDQTQQNLLNSDSDEEKEDVVDECGETKKSDLLQSGPEKVKGSKKMKSDRQKDTKDPPQKSSRSSGSSTHRSKRHDKEYGVSRGMDFQGISVIVNFDFPTSYTQYRHRVGRTARGHASGLSLSFVLPSALTIYNVICKRQEERGNPIHPFSFALSQIEGFRYRASDALTRVTKKAIKDAKMKQIRDEILSNDKLRELFKNIPDGGSTLEQLLNGDGGPQRDRSLTKVRQLQRHLKHIPDYMLLGMLQDKKRIRIPKEEPTEDDKIDQEQPSLIHLPDTKRGNSNPATFVDQMKDLTRASAKISREAAALTAKNNKRKKLKMNTRKAGKDPLRNIPCNG